MNFGGFLAKMKLSELQILTNSSGFNTGLKPLNFGGF